MNPGAISFCAEVDDLTFRRLGPVAHADDPALAGDGQMTILEIAMR